MTEGLSDNVKLQIILENNKNDRINQTGLLNKAMTAGLAPASPFVILSKTKPFHVSSIQLRRFVRALS